MCKPGLKNRYLRR